MKKKLDDLLQTPWRAYTMATCSAAVLYFLLTNLSFWGKLVTYISPILWGLLFAYIMTPLMNRIEGGMLKRIKNETVRHILAVIISLIVLIAVLVVFLIALIPSVIESITGIVNNVEYYGTNLLGYLDKISVMASRFHIDMSKITAAGEQTIQKMVTYITENADTIAGTFFSVGSSIANIVIGIVIAVYFLLDKKNLSNGVVRIRKLLLKKQTYERHNIFWERCHTILIRFMIFDIIEGIIIGLANMVFMFIFQMPNIALVSFIVGLTNLLPTFGPIIGALIGAVLLVLTSPMDALIFLIFTIILQTIDASILKPKMFGDSFGVPAVWIFIAIVVGGKMFGVLGILFAIPFAAIFTYILNEIVIPYLEERKGEKL